LSWPVALFLWNALGALVVFFGIERVLEGRRAIIAQGCMLLELLRGMQNAQSNALVAGLIVLAFAALEKRHAWRAALAVVLGTSVKIFPLAALTFAIPRRSVLKTGIATFVIAAVALVLPLLVTSPATLVAQYHSWQAVEASDALQRWYSVMELLYRWTGVLIPNWPVQLAGTLLLLAPLALRRDRWDDERFRFLYLCSVLLYVVLFNHQAERASYLIAFLGATLWFAGEHPTRTRDVLYALAFLTMPVMSTLIPGRVWRADTVTLYRTAVPTLLIWLVIQSELWRSAEAAAAEVETAADAGIPLTPG
jgi:hypothetical protein